ncbi:MAG: hypothetical protein LBC30_03235, partial [Puniceicoccales bacterium]|nr:hypothetical protein [Puniceicoccales bacterium]
MSSEGPSLLDNPFQGSGAEAPRMSPGQPSSIGEHELNPAQGGLESNPQPSLNDQQQVLKNKFGLSERVCASFNTEKEEVKTLVQDLEKGKFSPGPIKKFILWLSSKFGGPDYETTLQQFRVQTAAAKSQEIFKPEDFQRNLAAAIRSCNGEELPQALQGAYDLLAGDPEARRDFFINQLSIPCLEAAHDEILKPEGDVDIKILMENLEHVSKIKQLLGKNNLNLENERVRSLESNILAFLLPEAAYGAIVGSEILQQLRSLPLTGKMAEGLWSTHFQILDPLKNDAFSEILQCFDGNREEQVTSFKELMEGLRNIAKEVTAECGLDQDKWGRNFLSKAKEFLLGKSNLMYAMMKMSMADLGFYQIVFLEIIKFRGGGDDMPKLLPSVALETIRNAMDSTAETNESFSDEQVRLLCDRANLAALLEYQRDIEKNKGDIDMILQFIQAEALGNPPKISFEDIMPQTISSETCQRLQRFVEGGNYGQSL